MEVALVLEKNLVSPENVEFINESIVKGKNRRFPAGASGEAHILAIDYF